MSVVDGERITFKRRRPNPLFYDWLTELHDEAKQKSSKLEPLLKEALSSLVKYPLPLQNGAECAILQGFDRRLCTFLDKRLEAHKNSKTNCLNLCSGSNIFKYEEIEDSTNCCRNLVTSFISEYNEPKDIHTISQNKKVTPRYTCRSGSYAFIMVLKDLNETESIKKGDLMAAAQKYCDEDIALVWKNMTRLITRGLVKKSVGSKPRYSLTPYGFSVAKDLFKHTQKNGVDEVKNDFLKYNNKPEKCDSEVIFVNSLSNSKESLLNNNNMPNLTNTVKLDKDTDIDVVNVEDPLVVENNDLIEMEPGSFDIVLLIDKNETSGLSKKKDRTVSQFNKYPELKHEYRSLKVGDFAWIARHKIHINQELALPYIIERKRMDDLGASIKDGRFHEQKFRLRKCGLNNVIYMVENHGSNKHVGLPMQSLMRALANTRVQEGFKVHMTDSLTDSIQFLAMMTLRLTYEYKHKKLKGHNRDPVGDILMTFQYFNKSSMKNKALSVTETFIKLLLQLKGVSVEKALAITTMYKTPRLLIEAYESCDKRNGEMLLANLRFGETNRSIGLTVSKSIYQLFTSRSIT